MGAPPSSVTVGVVVVSYHSVARPVNYVLNELPKLPWQYHACVVEVDASDESRREFQNALPPEVLYLPFKENLGYGKGNNRGAEALLAKYPDCRYLLICNDDVEIPPDANLGALTDFLECRPECAVAGPDCVGKDGLSQSPWDAAADLGAEEGSRPSPFGGESRECYAVRGCFFLVRTEAFLAAGGFDERFFLFFEEPALSEKLRERALVTHYCAEAKVVHLGSATIKKALSSWKIYKIYRKSFLLMAKYYWKWSAWKRLTWPLRHVMAKLLR